MELGVFDGRIGGSVGLLEVRGKLCWVEWDPRNRMEPSELF